MGSGVLLFITTCSPGIKNPGCVMPFAKFCEVNTLTIANQPSATEEVPEK